MAPKEGNVKDGEPIPEGLATGPYFYFRQLLGLLVTTLGVVFSIVCFDQYYYGMSNLLVTWTGLIVSVGGLIIHETRPYKRWDDWTLIKGWLAKNTDEPEAVSCSGQESKKSK